MIKHFCGGPPKYVKLFYYSMTVPNFASCQEFLAGAEEESDIGQNIESHCKFLVRIANNVQIFMFVESF